MLSFPNSTTFRDVLPESRVSWRGHLHATQSQWRVMDDFPLHVGRTSLHSVLKSWNLLSILTPLKANITYTSSLHWLVDRNITLFSWPLDTVSRFAFHWLQNHWMGVRTSFNVSCECFYMRIGRVVMWLLDLHNTRIQAQELKSHISPT